MKKSEKTKTLELLKHHGNSNKERHLKGRGLSIKTVELRSSDQTASLGSFPRKQTLAKDRKDERQNKWAPTVPSLGALYC